MTKKRTVRTSDPQSEPARGGSNRVSLCPEGLSIGGRTVPLLAGSMHYWHHDPSEWDACLDALVSLGVGLVDTYVPWGVHEDGPSDFDFGDRTPAKNVARFLELAHKKGLFVILRPGPHINAELTFFGIPERVIWDPDCQARTPRNHPVVLPMLPRAFPVPSYASDAFFEEVEKWYRAVGDRLAHLVYPNGPTVAVQVDNEGALYFRDGPYDQDYHPDAIRKFREFLRGEYGDPEKLSASWGVSVQSFAKAEPPKRLDAKTAADLPRHMDWMEFHERLLGDSLARLSQSLRDVGLGSVPLTHNFPLGEAVTALNPRRVTHAVDLVGIDYYHRANPTDHGVLMRRTTELVSRCDGRGVPPFGAEVGAGGPPFLPAMDEQDSMFTVMAALAYGLRGFNIYMAVERDRWMGAPIDPRGYLRPFAKRWQSLLRAIERVELWRLRRPAPVRLIVPRTVRRLARAMHAFGPVTPALFHVLGAGYTQNVLETDFDLPSHPVLAAEEFLRSFEHALLLRGVPFAYAGSETAEESSLGAKWAICGLGAGASEELFRRLQGAQARGVAVTIGPRIPDRDGRMALVPHPVDRSMFELAEGGSSALSRVDRAIAEHNLPTYACEPSSCTVSVLEDSLGKPKVLFLVNPTDEKVFASITTSVPSATDLMDESEWTSKGGALAIPIAARTVRMLLASA